jgi:hypothetical protein
MKVFLTSLLMLLFFPLFLFGCQPSAKSPQPQKAQRKPLSLGRVSGALMRSKEKLFWANHEGPNGPPSDQQLDAMIKARNRSNSEPLRLSGDNNE